MINKIKSKLPQVDFILHIADIHLRNWKRHTEFKEVFKKLLIAVDNLPENSIVTVGGDIVHAKTDMSPELINMVSYLFNQLADRRPTIVICGNHDTNLNNNNRLDALTPIIEANSHPNLYYLRNSGLYEIGDIAISVMSLLDPITDYVTVDKINLEGKKYKHLLAMYHGTIANSQVDSGLMLSHGLEWDTFAGFDLVLLGDIHKRQVSSKQDPIIFYPGSLVQQNFGESFEGHGYALVDLTEKDNIKYDFYDIPNQYGFFTLDVVDGVLPDNLPITAKTNVRLRVRGTSSAELKRILATIRKTYKNSDVLVQKLDKLNASGDNQLFGESIYQGDIRNVQYQNQLISDYLKHQDIDDETLEQVLKINALLNQSVDQGETVRNVVWKPKKFEFSNMFSYGEDNVVMFNELEGTCGLFAPNHAGKSAVLDALCFCLFDHSLRATKAEQVLNRKKDGFSCKFNFELGGLDYFIEKKATRYAKGPLAGKLRVDIDFWCINAEGETVSLNGEQRRDTDKIIQSYVGTFDDFILTALSLQGNDSNFIDKTQGERKDLLANFLDLRIFDTLYELANRENRTAVILLEEYQKQDFETKLGDAERSKEVNEKKHIKAQEDVEVVETELTDYNNQLLDLNKQLQPCNADGLDIAKLQKGLTDSTDRYELLGQQASKAQLDLQDEKLVESETYKELTMYKNSFDTALYKEYTTKVQEKLELDGTLSTLKLTISNKLSKLEKLNQHEYDPNCQYCTSNVFVKDAVDTKTQLENDKQTVHDFLQELKAVSDFIETNKHIQTAAENIQTLLKSHSEAKTSVERQANLYDRLKKDMAIEKHKIAKFNSDIKTYEDSVAILSNNKIIYKDIKVIETAVGVKKIELSRLNNIVKDYHGKVRVAEQTIQECEKTITHMQELADKQVAYDQYCRAICKDGIPYVLISKAVPYIQDYANNILNQIIDFTIELETDGKNINAFIVYGDTKWPLELSSGMERFMASLALRIALIKITNLPKPDFIAIDEGLGVLDSSNLNSMHTLFTYMKDVFRFTLIISHIDVVRDMVDNIITIDKQGDFSHINC
jgi:DNA repair exonuclease SbcCD ATPase subunit/DNA repair exonuclease SbcCD nuclease subunit